MRDCLLGAYEMHVHTAPDVTPRKCTDIELARRFQEVGLAGALIKCHYADTAARAALLTEQFPDLRFYGGVALNNSVGGLNPEAVATSGKMGGKIVWFPTMDALNYREFHGAPDDVLRKCLRIVDDGGELLPAARAVMETAKEYGMMVGTGHTSPEEGMAVVRAGSELGLQVVLTHADNPADFYTAAQQREAVRLGAVVEHCYFTTYYDRTPIETVAEQIRAVGVENVFLASDFGQVKSPCSDEGLSRYADLFAAQGFSEGELTMMFRDTPARLLGLKR